MNKDSKIVGKRWGVTGSIVEVDGAVLTPIRSFFYREHSPDGFSWGYGGSGPAQFALALLLEATDEMTAVNKYQNFKRDVVAKLEENFTLNAGDVYKWLEEHK